MCGVGVAGVVVCGAVARAWWEGGTVGQSVLAVGSGVVEAAQLDLSACCKLTFLKYKVAGVLQG